MSVCVSGCGRRPHGQLWRAAIATAAAAIVGWSATLTAQDTASPTAVVGQTVRTEVEPGGYDSAGRRDPFVSLLRSDASAQMPEERPRGLAGLARRDLSLRGLVETRGAYLAVTQGPDGKTYILQGGEQLFDATVERVGAGGLVWVVHTPDGTPRLVVTALHTETP